MFKIFVDSAGDIPLELAAQLDIDVISYYVSFDGEKYRKEHIDISVSEFYRVLVESKVFPKTSMPTTEDFCNAFSPYLDRGIDILHISLTSCFSGAYQCGVLAASQLKEKYPDRKIFIVNSGLATLSQGMVAMEAAKLRDMGMSIDETVEKVDKMIATGGTVLTVDSLEFLQRGGRIGKTSALAGGILNIKPIIVLEDGELIPYGKIRGRKKALEKIMEMSKERMGDVEKYSIAVAHSQAKDEAKEVINTLNSKYSCGIDLPPFELGVTIGAHIGPTVIAISYVKKSEYV